MIKRKEGFSGERALVLPQSVISEMERDAYTSILHITDIGYYPKAQHHFRHREQPIDQYVFIYCVEGTGWFTLNNHEYKVEPNQYFILPAGVNHSYGSSEDTPWTIYWIHFKGKLASYFAANKNYPIDIRPSIHSRISDRISLFEELLRTLEMGYSRENLQYACTVFHHYLGTLHNLQQYRNAVQKQEQQLDVVAATIHYMQENIEKKLSLEDIAIHAGYSSSHFSALFGKRTGYTPLAYFNQLKIQKACNLLDFTDMKINQICYKIGLDDTFYFSRLFTKVMGISPREYRKMKKG
ncbi:AraC family transcriptional regulator [Parabacteroides sp. OttesenSCG-928-G06]|nr:AraC family transcriptional regulator [Parabacteroides sp. OttesenSCG-928-G06]